MNNDIFLSINNKYLLNWTIWINEVNHPMRSMRIGEIKNGTKLSSVLIF